jgi:pimeloyl-ACP methyl ester carboxylesterase
MEAMAKNISRYRGVIEALQTRHSIESLLVELRGVLTRQGHPPVTLIGHSWGAWLSILFASKYPGQVKKLILVGSGPLEEKYASKVMETRLDRLDENDTARLNKLMHQINTAPERMKDRIFLEMADLLRKADAFQPDGEPYVNTDFDYRMFESVWAEAESMRSSGGLIRHAARLTCPVTAIHGVYDPHPVYGIKLPLEKTIKDFRLILLEKCGHEPWSEISAKDSFYATLENEL